MLIYEKEHKQTAATHLVGCDLQSVDGLQQLGLLVQQLCKCFKALNLRQPALFNSLCFMLPPVLQLVVQDLKVLACAWVHPALDFCVVLGIGLRKSGTHQVRNRLDKYEHQCHRA